MAVTAAIAVTPKATIGFCPCPTAKEVITPAPSPATTKEFNQSLELLLYINPWPTTFSLRLMSAQLSIAPIGYICTEQAPFCNEPLCQTIFLNVLSQAGFFSLRRFGLFSAGIAVLNPAGLAVAQLYI